MFTDKKTKKFDSTGDNQFLNKLYLDAIMDV